MAIANITNNILTDSGVATSSLLPLTGGTLTGGLIGQNATFDGNLRVGTLIGSLEVGYASAIGTHKLDVSGTGNFTGALTGTSATFSSTLGINGVADNVKASTYSPTLTGVLNYTSGSGNICTFIRIANIVTVFFDINVSPTAILTKTECYISLPIPSTFTSFVGVGSGVGDVTSGYIPVLAAYGGGTNIVISFYSPATLGTLVLRGSFSYEVT
jgi:hypothetical protein